MIDKKFPFLWKFTSIILYTFLPIYAKIDFSGGAGMLITFPTPFNSYRSINNEIFDFSINIRSGYTISALIQLEIDKWHIPFSLQKCHIGYAYNFTHKPSSQFIKDKIISEFYVFSSGIGYSLSISENYKAIGNVNFLISFFPSPIGKSNKYFDLLMARVNNPLPLLEFNISLKRIFLDLDILVNCGWRLSLLQSYLIKVDNRNPAVTAQEKINISLPFAGIIILIKSKKD